VSIGQDFTPTWSTHWFKVVVKIPDSWDGREVHLRWNSNSEALLLSSDGEPLQGLTGSPEHQNREEFIISKCWNASRNESEMVYYVEMSCNSMFGAGKGGFIDPPDPNRKFNLQRADVSVFDRRAYQLWIDLELMYEMAKEMTEEQGKGDSRGYQALYAANEIINAFQADNVKEAERLSMEFFSYGNGERAHTIEVMGHCHIDTAWLWPYDETIRKCSRSWSSVVTLMQDYPQMTFVCSQAQQFSWIKQYYPALYAKIKVYVDQGRFIPVGGTWVEMDGNIPSGESFIRQFLYGQRFFLKEFGLRCQEFWLPDTFGYSAQTPQIMKHVGISRFLTQKLSWNLVNKFPHHNFWWQGLDGSSVLVHFPPGDSYEANCKVSEALKTERNLLDKGRVSQSVMLYGFGDGGGGPHRAMLDRLQRLKDVDGVPKLMNSNPKQFFDRLEAEGSKLCRWVGELYLELHNGTYTSQADMKRLNRRCESKLREAELLLSISLVKEVVPAAQLNHLLDSITEAWRLLMVNQFHDVLPGTSIEMVHKEASEWFARCQNLADGVIHQSLGYLTAAAKTAAAGIENSLLNTLPWSRRCLVYKGDQPVEAVTVAPMSWNNVPVTINHPLRIDQTGGLFRVTNEFFSVDIDLHGRIVSMVHLSSGNEVIGSSSGGCHGNQLVLFDDIPLYWDAWDCMDYHQETRQTVNKPLESTADDWECVHIEVQNHFRVTLKWSQRVGQRSHVTQRIHITAIDAHIEFETMIDWRENRKFLKVEFPVNVHAQNASFDTQFGHLSRATHKNTSWDSARFEVCGHRWADLSEPQWGVAVLNDSKYGWNVQGHTITLSLLRSPKAPDANCDMHRHTFRYALLPHQGLNCRSDVVRTAYNFNCATIPVAVSRTNGTSIPWFHVDSPSVILETIKPAEPALDGSHSSARRIVLRLFESCGGRTQAKIFSGLSFAAYQECNGLEEPCGEAKQFLAAEDGQVSFGAAFSPFQIRTFLLSY